MALLLFDIDGTLLYTDGSGRDAASQSFKKYFHIKDAFKNVHLMGRTDQAIWKEVCKMNHIFPEDYEKVKNRLLEDYYAFLKRNLIRRKKGYIYPGIKEILQKVHSHHALGLLTGNFKHGAMIKLAHFDLDKFFPVGGFADDDEDRNNIARIAITRAKQHYALDFQNKDIYIIGDTPFDIKCALSTQTKSVAVATGGYSFEDLKKHKPDYLFHSFKEIDSFLKIIKK
ncbi:MAG: HAD hydrolase-like protein [Spirochaetes bacterium]|nr:HAD hydrolase-like protein [Spirochaetota bacterium]